MAQGTVSDKLNDKQTIRPQLCGSGMGQYMEHTRSQLIEFARLVEEGVTDGPDGRLQPKFSPCLFITLF